MGDFSPGPPRDSLGRSLIPDGAKREMARVLSYALVMSEIVEDDPSELMTLTEILSRLEEGERVEFCMDCLTTHGRGVIAIRVRLGELTSVAYVDTETYSGEMIAHTLQDQLHLIRLNSLTDGKIESERVT